MYFKIYYYIDYRDFKNEKKFDKRISDYTFKAIYDPDIEVRNNCLDLVFCLAAGYNEKQYTNLLKSLIKKFKKLDKEV